MSRVGRKPIPVPENVSLKIERNTVAVAGPKGELAYKIPDGLEVTQEDRVLTVARRENSLLRPGIYGLFARILGSAIAGVTNGWGKTLVLIGTGYRARLEGGSLVLTLGFSHPVRFDPPEGVSFAVSENKVVVSGIDRGVVGQIAANIRATRPPEPYQGKGVRYEGEYVRKKAGKSAKTGVKVG